MNKLISNRIIVLGAGGHAVEVIDILMQQYDQSDIHYFDNVSKNIPSWIGSQNIVTDSKYLDSFKSFYLGVGGIRARKYLSTMASEMGLLWEGIRCNYSSIGKIEVVIHDTADIMSLVHISSCVSIGKGTLINRNVSVHHGCKIGSFCEIAPSSTILGNVHIGDEVFIGAGAIIFPNITIADKAIVGAGAVVNKNIGRAECVVGNPAKKINRNS